MSVAIAETSREPKQPSRLEKKKNTEGEDARMHPSPVPAAPGVTWVVDAMNVIGARPDGWWRDRDGAVRALVDAVGGLVARTGERAVVVLDGPVPRGTARRPGVEVLPASRRGRDAADDAIVARVAAASSPAALRVASSDARLAGRVRALGAGVEGAGRFRARLDRWARVASGPA